MKTIGFTIIFGIMQVVLFQTQGITQEFDFGSDGSYGEINLTEGSSTTLDMPDDGIFQCTTITIEPGAVLRFNRNTHNTPVYLLATGDVQIDGTITVNGGSGTVTPPVGGIGGPGGFDGGVPGILEVAPGDGHGPGGGKGGNRESSFIQNSAGSGSYATRPQQNTSLDGSTYGSPLLVPLVGGSGGAGTTGQPGVGGGGGGGAILIASNTRITINESGRISARGGYQNVAPNAGPNPGSGGAIRLLAPIVEGTGQLDVRGGLDNWGDSEAGDGRIRIDTIIREGMLFQYLPLETVSIGSYMAAFPTIEQRLDILNVAGQEIAEGFPGVVQVFLPFGEDPSKQVTVQGRGFTGLVPIEVVLTPNAGSSIIYDATLDMTTDPAQVTVDVELPFNTLTSLYAWTK